MSGKFFATCPKGTEQLLAQELRDLEAQSVRETVAGASFVGDLRTAYRVCLWSRLANKVLMPIAKYPVADAGELYQAALDVDWSRYLATQGRLWIDFVGTSNNLRNSQFSAQRLKDAIVDRLRDLHGNRPSIDREQPDLIVNARLSKGQLVINLDLCGESLHRRGYRVDSVKAPLKENLAAALLLRGDWPRLAGQGASLIDPMCGSGTLLIEAALMAADIAPALQRAQFAFERWPQFQADPWQQLKQEAVQRKAEGLARKRPIILGYDDDVLAIRATERNISAAGLTDWIRVRRKSLDQFKRPTHTELPCGLLITNPPYGERLGEVKTLMPLYRQLGRILKTDFVGWSVAVFTGNPELGKAMNMRSHKKYKLFNGAIATQLLLFKVEEKYFYSDNDDDVVSADAQHPAGSGSQNENYFALVFNRDGPLSDGAQMVANRLRKNTKQLRHWLQGNAITCYRLYDADIPEYAAAIDVYGDYFHVQEYAAPKSIDPESARLRFTELLQALITTFETPSDHLSIKQRRRSRGKNQYEVQAPDSLDRKFQVREGSATFWVNLWAYLDTGLFLDHRPLRLRIAAEAEDKRLLNLFCYTASITVHAILGGARSSVSVDMSKTYIDWARENFRANHVDERRHQLIQADCNTWLNTCRQPFDLIVLDPPSFSNSKRMADVLDIQRDHVGLIQRCMELLAPGGALYFSTNLRKFKLDEVLLKKYNVEDINSKTIDPDFQRNPKIHHCWKITPG